MAFALLWTRHFIELASERSKRDTIRGVQIRAGAVYIYVCMEVCVP